MPIPPVITGNRRLLAAKAVQGRAATRDDHVNVFIQPQQLGHQRPIRVGDRLHCGGRDAAQRQRILDHLRERQVAVERLAAPRRIAALPVLRQSVAMSMVTFGRAS